MQQLCLSLLVSDPIEPPPKETPPKATEEEGNVVILDAKLFYKQQEKEVAEKIKESLAVTEYAKPSSALVLSGVSSSVVQYTVFEMQLSFTVLDTEGAPTNDLGHKSDPWQVTASLLGGPPGAILMGTTTVPNRNGTAIFTNLSVSKPGEGYNLTFTIIYPSYAPALTTTLEETFSLTQMSAAMVLQQPSIVQAGQPTTITVHFVDKDSGLVFNGLAFKDWWCIPHIWSSRSTPWSSPCTPICSDGSSWRVWRMWIYLPKNNLSTIPVDVVISEVSVRYQLAAQVSVVPAGWHLHFVSPGLVVYPENLKIQENCHQEPANECHWVADGSSSSEPRVGKGRLLDHTTSYNNKKRFIQTLLCCMDCISLYSGRSSWAIQVCAGRKLSSAGFWIINLEAWK
ncbi:uncharacterized protein LOC135098357 isoform X3 [Scylla paramamosain]|uniref:uncharacterized protein LOC135098357 isoform X3 n=1 Tax=Scylla paramamosain TaxID=85552 RepID=UPI0030827AB1